MLCCGMLIAREVIHFKSSLSGTSNRPWRVNLRYMKGALSIEYKLAAIIRILLICNLSIFLSLVGVELRLPYLGTVASRIK
jgi:hypothetical protein